MAGKNVEIIGFVREESLDVLRSTGRVGDNHEKSLDHGDHGTGRVVPGASADFQKIPGARRHPPHQHFQHGPD
jgi:hypothetical protein